MMCLPVSLAPVNVMRSTRGSVRERLADLARAEAVHDVEDAVGQAGLERELREPRRRRRRLLGRLEDDRVAERERGRELPGREHQRRVPRADRDDDAGGRVQHVRQPPGLAVGLVARQRRVVGEEAQVQRRARDVVVARGAEQPPGVARLEQRQLIGVLLDQGGERVQQRAALLGVHPRPGAAVEGARARR